MRTTEQRAEEIESKVRELAVAAELDPEQLGMLLHVELEQFSNYPITVHLLGNEWIPAAIKNGAGIVGSTVGISKPMESFSRLQEFEGTMLGMLGTILPAHRMQEIEQAVARGARVSVFHFRKKLRGQDGIWGITIVWEKDSAANSQKFEGAFVAWMGIVDEEQGALGYQFLLPGTECTMDRARMAGTMTYVKDTEGGGCGRSAPSLGCWRTRCSLRLSPETGRNSTRKFRIGTKASEARTKD